MALATTSLDYDGAVYWYRYALPGVGAKQSFWAWYASVTAASIDAYTVNAYLSRTAIQVGRAFGHFLAAIVQNAITIVVDGIAAYFDGRR